jgi:hypothetical protein
MHAVTSEHDGGKQFGFVTKVFWQSSRVDSVGQLVSSKTVDVVFADTQENYKR